MSIDGMHCETEEFQLNPNAKWYSEKKNTSGLTYEIGCAINHDKCSWLRGPFPAGDMKFWFTPSPIISFLNIYFLYLTIAMHGITMF